MAVVTSPHSTSITFDQTQRLKMASLSEEHVPTNGVDRVPHATPDEPSVNSDVPDKTSSDIADNHAKNIDVFVSNASLNVATEETKIHAEAEADTSAIVAVAANPPASTLDTKPILSETITGAPEHRLTDTTFSRTTNTETNEDDTAKSDQPSAETALVLEEAAEQTMPAEEAENNEAVTRTSQVSALGNAVLIATIAETRSASPTPVHSQAASSSLLPSLRGEGSREPMLSSANVDTAMSDMPLGKVAREREDDTEAGRSVKRAKTEDTEGTAALSPSQQSAIVAEPTGGMQLDTPTAYIPARVRTAIKEGSLADPSLDSLPVTPYASSQIRKVLASVKKTKAGINFKEPVFKKWPLLWESYQARVQTPMDISTIEHKLRDSKYKTQGDFINDVFLIFENSVAFNGLNNIVTEEAKSMIENFFARLSEIPSREPQKANKKEPKQLPTRQTEPRVATSRRESKGAATSPIEDSVTAFSASPASASTGAMVGNLPPTGSASGNAESNPVFAVPATGVPIIRRDSTKIDGDRPKRPIHPPKNRDLGYEPKNPKKKLPEFRFCEEVLKELMKQRHYETNHWFLKPVDAVAMQIPTYHKIIKKPMDLGTMQTKLSLGEYNSTKEFESDIQLIVKNCRKFNLVGEVVDAANRLEELYKVKWTEKDAWIASHTTHHVSTNPSAAGGGKEDDSEEDGDDSDVEGDDISVALPTSDTVDALVKRLQEENVRLNTLLAAKIPDMTMITTQQTVLNMIQKQIVEEKTKLAAAESDKRTKKSAKAKPAKGKKAYISSGSTKRSAGAVGSVLSKKSSTSTSKKASKPRTLGQAEKNVVTEGINSLDPQLLERAIDIIKKDTNQEESEDGELELDIDQLSQDALGRLYELIIKAFPHLKVKTDKIKMSGEGGAVGKPSKPKKHKPMGRLEQERNIEKLREIKAQFQRPGSGSQEPLPSVEVSQAIGDESEEESEADSEEE